MTLIRDPVLLRRFEILCGARRAFAPYDEQPAAPPKLADDDALVATLRSRYANGETQTALAREYGLSQGRVSRIISGRRY